MELFLFSWPSLVKLEKLDFPFIVASRSPIHGHRRTWLTWTRLFCVCVNGPGLVNAKFALVHFLIGVAVL